MRWITAPRVIAINREVVGATGEPHLLRSTDLLQGALDRPRNLCDYEGVTDIVALGVRLMVAIGLNHCFEQGNKRTAFVAGILFLELNGVLVELGDTVGNAELILQVVTGLLDERSLIELLNARVM